VNLLRRQAKEIATTSFHISDLSAKLRFILGKQSSLGVKLSAYDETSNSTYVGLTQAMYDRGEFFTRIAPDDELIIRGMPAAQHTTTCLRRTSHFEQLFLGTPRAGIGGARNSAAQAAQQIERAWSSATLLCERCHLFAQPNW